MDTIETQTTTRTLRFRTDTDDVTAWLSVNGQGEKIVGSYWATEGSGWVAHADLCNSLTFPNTDVRSWCDTVRLVHLYR